jgi:hypothetical protein
VGVLIGSSGQVKGQRLKEIAGEQSCESHQGAESNHGEMKAGGAERHGRNQSRAMAVPAMLEHGRDARGTKSSRATSR